MVATISANNSVIYSKVYYDYSLEEWVEIVHKYNSLKHNWNYIKLEAGTFGFDNIVISLYYLFENSNYDDLRESNIEKLSNLIHEGLIINYIYWRDNRPWEKSEDYIKPYSPLGDERRNYCAETKYNELNEEEKEKDRIIVKCILENIQ